MRNIVLSVFILFAYFSSGQGIADFEYIRGDLSFLKSESVINVVFSWDSIAVGKFKTEEEYIAKKVAEHNSAESGKGDQWVVEWNSNKTIYFEPGFIEGLNDRFKKTKQIQFIPNSDGAKYSMLVSTVYIERGSKGDPIAGHGSIPAEIILLIRFINHQENNKVVAKIKMHRYEMVADYNYTSQVSLYSAYIQTGKGFAKYVDKEILK